MLKYILQKSPFIVPTNDGKIIEEHFGAASENIGDYSVAHMIAPPGWNEPFQVPDFDEITYIIRGKKMIIIGDEKIILEKNNSIYIKKGTKVKYSNPFDKEVEYMSFCIPAFTLDRVKREEN